MAIHSRRLNRSIVSICKWPAVHACILLLRQRWSLSGSWRWRKERDGRGVAARCNRVAQNISATIVS